MKYTYLFLLLFFSYLTLAQGPQFVQQNGYNAIDVIFNNNPEHPKLGNMSYATCCPPPYVFNDPIPFQFTAEVTNAGMLAADSVYFRSLEKTPGANFDRYVYSDTVLLLPGDTVVLSGDMITDPLFFSDGLVRFELFSGNQLFAKDSLPMAVWGADTGYISQNFGPADGYLSTQDFGAPLYFAMLLPIDQWVEVSGVYMDFGPGTIPGGDMLIELYDSSAFDPDSGFTGTAVASVQPIVLNNYQGLTFIPLQIQKSINDKHPIKYYYLVVKLFSNQHANTIEIGSSSRIKPAKGSVLYQEGANGPWKDSRDAGNLLNTPALTIETYILHWDPHIINLEEAQRDPVRIFPNPAEEVLYIEVPESWSGGNYHVELYDLRGTLLIKPQILENDKIDLRVIPTGMYTVRVISDDGFFEERLVVLE